MCRNERLYVWNVGWRVFNSDHLQIDTYNEDIVHRRHTTSSHNEVTITH